MSTDHQNTIHQEPEDIQIVPGCTFQERDIPLTRGFFVDNQKNLVEVQYADRKNNSYRLRERMFGMVFQVLEIPVTEKGKTDEELVRLKLPGEDVEINNFNGITNAISGLHMVIACNGYMLRFIGNHPNTLLIHIRPTGQVAPGCAADLAHRGNANTGNSLLGTIKKLFSGKK